MLAKGIFSVAASASDPDLLIVKKNNAVIGSKPVRISGVRAYLLGHATAQYTLNAAIRIARFVSKELGLNYQVSTNLKGTAADDVLIIPDKIAMGIVLLQAHRGITIDGAPGADFIRKVMGLHQNIVNAAHCRSAFMDESNNATVNTPDGKLILMPDFTADETLVYDFLRQITLARNGLWSDRAQIVNITALRLEHGAVDIQWDDTISICWLDSEGNKKAKVYTATTEPGNRKIFKTLLPQTIIFIPGYHQGKLPAMRGHRLVVFDPTIKFPHRLLYTTNDARGLNLHPGGTTGSMKNLVKYIFPVGAQNEVEFKAVLVLMEIFEILSRWGLHATKPAWEVLSGWAATKALRTGPVQNGVVPVFQDETTQAVKFINIASARTWLAKKWSLNRALLLKILRSVDLYFVPPTDFNALNNKGLELLISDKHIEGIVRRQCDFFFDLKAIDGLAGNTYLSLLNAEIPRDGALAQLANRDFARMSALLQQFNNTHPVLTPARREYVKKIRTQTLQERAKLLDAQAAVLEVTGQPVEENVGTWSILCQVVFGPEMFYEMMRYTVGNALQTGQRRWYYTLIDEATVPKEG
jgi:hypothetical protein